MKHLSTIALLAALAAAPAAVATAQDRAPAIQPSPIQPEGEPLIQWRSGQMDVREMLRALDEVCPQTILIGEGVAGQRLTHDGRPMRLPEFLDTLCEAAGLTWGYLNRDTIVVMPARPYSPRLVAPHSVPELGRLPAPFGFRFAPRTPGLGIPRGPLTPFVPSPPVAPGTEGLPRVAPLDPDPHFSIGKKPDSVPENAIPHLFNGQTVYIIPLEQAAAPEAHEPTR